MSEKTSEPATPKPGIDELRAEIKQTRAELGETVQALAAKADVKARALDQVEHAKARALGRVEHARLRVQQQVRTSPVPLALVVAGVAAVVGVFLIVRGRKR